MNNNDWATKQNDLEAARAIAEKHLDLDDDTNTLGFFVLNLQMNQPLQLKRADWVIELSEYFDTTYGVELGSEITEKVLCNLLLEESTVH